MPFFEPTIFDEFVGRLASIRRKPPEEVWHNICRVLDQRDRERHYRQLTNFTIAAGFALLVVAGYTLLTQSLSRPEVQDLFVQADALSTEVAPTIPDAYYAAVKDQQVKGADKPAKPLEADETTHISAINSSEENLDLPLIPEAQPSYSYIARAEVGSIDPAFGLPQGATPAHNHKRAAKWSVIVTASPAYTYHSAGIISTNSNPNEIGRWMWGGGVTVQRRTTKNTSMFFGVNIAPVGQRVNDMFLVKSKSGSTDVQGIEANTSFGQVSLSSPTNGITETLESDRASVMAKSGEITTGFLNQSFHYLEIPFMVSRSFKTNSLAFELKVGASGAFLLSNRFDMATSNGHYYGSTDGVKPFSFAAHAAVNISYPISNRVALHVEPTLTTMLQPLYNSSTLNLPVSYAFKVGVGYNL